jgi:hypothetical protein
MEESLREGKEEQDKLRKWKAEQATRAVREEARREEMDKKRREELEATEKAKEREKALKQEAKLQLRLMEQEKRMKRQEALKAKSALLTTPVPTPTNYAHHTLAADFYRRVVVPDIEREQELKAQRRIMQKSPTLQDLKAHSRKYAQLLAEQQEKAREEMRGKMIDFKLQEVNIYPQTQASRDLQAREQENKLLAAKEAEQKRLLRLRQIHYALLVKEMFGPKTQPRASESPRALPKHALTPIKRINRPKFKLAASVPALPQAEKKEIVVKDYLNEMKQLRASMNLPTEYDVNWEEEFRDEMEPMERMQRLRTKADVLERRLRQAESKLQVANPASPGVLEATQKLSDSLVASIQAKLRLLQA